MNALLQFALPTLALITLAGFLYLGVCKLMNWFCFSPTVDAIFRKLHQLLSDHPLSNSVFTHYDNPTD